MDGRSALDQRWWEMGSVSIYKTGQMTNDQDVAVNDTDPISL